jgi:hypothetical protein
MLERRLVLAAMIALAMLVALIGFFLFGIAVWIVDVSRPFSEAQHPTHHSAFVQTARDVAGLVIAGVVVGAVVFMFRGDGKRSIRRRGQPSRSVD